MKLKALAALLVSSLLATSAMAATYASPTAQRTGYAGPSAEPEATVAQARSAADGTYAVLEGRITKRLSHHEHYEFTDTTGSITVDIDDEDWPEQIVDENTKVRIYGEVDKDFSGTDIDVDYIVIVQ